jgi:precorrin-6B methylase 1
MMLIINLDDEAEKYLIEILSEEQTNSQELIKKLLRNHLSNLKKKTVLERMGGYPEHLLEGTGNLSDRDTRKHTIAERIRQKQEKRLH